jgi:hypothetical protein
MLAHLTAALLLVASLALWGLSGATGAAHAEGVVCTDFQERILYHSSQTPGWTSWVGLAKREGKRLYLTFTEITGDVTRSPSYDYNGCAKRTLFMRSENEGQTWNEVFGEVFPGPWNNPGNYGLQALADGSLLMPYYGFYWTEADFPRTGCLRRSTDGGRTWSDLVLTAKPEWGDMAIERIIQLRDGTVMAANNGVPEGKPKHSRWVHSGILLSRDSGRPWSEPIITMPNAKGLVACCETAIAELPDGDVLMIARVENYPDPDDDSKYHPGTRRQCLLHRVGDDWHPGPVVRTDIPHGGHPTLLWVREGFLLYVAVEGYWYTFDKGRTWGRIEMKGAGYYPQAVQLDDGRVLAAFQYGGDNAFPPPNDMAIGCQVFRLTAE